MMHARFLASNVMIVPADERNEYYVRARDAHGPAIRVKYVGARKWIVLSDDHVRLRFIREVTGDWRWTAMAYRELDQIMTPMIEQIVVDEILG
jgi:hypothetical protein